MVRTRFAPSPTGYLHVGGLRAALYAYLFAKKNGGKFILRIEDTDQKRFVEGAMENLINTLTYAGLTIDEGPISPEKQIGDHGPYIQSQRTELYREHVQQLIDNGHAYRCFCTKERLDEMRQRQLDQGQPTMYDRKCADLPESEVSRLIAEGNPFVIRQKIPYEVIKFKDIIRGNVQFHGKTIDDQVLMKSDGFPTYHLANVVDDHLMEITHVIRGEEWLPSTPKHLALYQAFGWEAPQFAHMPLLLNADRTKLSKRQGDVAVENYVEKGYLKEAIINFITFLGWNPGAGETREIFTLKELEEIFELDKVHKSGAIFDLEKLNWFNQKWQKRKLDEQLSTLAKNIDPQVEIETNNKGQISYTFSSASTESKFQEQRGEILKTLLKEPLETSLSGNKLLFALVTIEDKIIREPDETKQHLAPFEELANYPSQLLTHEKMGVDLSQAVLALQSALEDLQQLSDWRPSTIKQQIINTISKLGLKNGQMLWPLRVALSGQEFSPGPFDLAWGLGKDQSIDRIKIAITKCQ